MFKKIGEFFKSVFNKAIKIFKSFIAEVLPVAKQIIIAALKDIAIEAVTELSTTNLSNEEKRQVAFDKIKDFAEYKKMKVSDSIINVIIELALQKLKV